MAKYSLIDSPLTTAADDSLEIQPYVDAMAEFIRGCDTPLTIGIQGDWGSGKTSFLNMLKEQLGPPPERPNRYHTVYFNTWQYSQFNQEDGLSLSILRGITRGIEDLAKNEPRDDRRVRLQYSLGKFKSFVGSLGNQVLRSQTGIDFKEAMTGDEGGTGAPDLVEHLSIAKGEFAELIQSILEGVDDKLVIMIDDLDRIKPIRALEVLDAVKNFLDVPGCVFLIAVDYSVVQRGMEEKLGRTAQEMQGKSYFDKIIQVPFNMPVGAYKTDAYIMALLGWKVTKEGYVRDRDECYLTVSDKVLDLSHAEFFVNVTRLTVGANPRSLKRAVNYATLLKIVVKENRKGSNLRWKLEDAKVLYSLACLQFAWPEVFSLLAGDPAPGSVSRFQDYDSLKAERGLQPLFTRVHNPEETRSNISWYFAELMSLVDKNEDGAVSVEEFKPIRAMMLEANMISTGVEDLDRMWETFERMIEDATGEIPSPAVKSQLGLFRHESSTWNDPTRIRLVRAGKRFLNVMWEKRQIGSIVTTQKEPLQVYMKADPTELMSILGENAGTVIDVSAEGHYGVGDSKVDLAALASRRDGVGRMNQLHAAVCQINGMG